MKKSLSCLSLVFFGLATLSYAENAPKSKAAAAKAASEKSGTGQIVPLFPVAIPFAFPNGKTAFEESKKLILENYYSPTINEESLYWAAIRGMLRQISPPENREHSKLLQPIQADAEERLLSGKSTSIGISTSFNPRDGSLTVTDIIPESPAEGLINLDDRILRINQVTLVGKKAEEVLKLLEGKVGETIKLTVVRDIKVIEVPITRKEFTVHSLNVYRLPNSVGLIEIHRITHNVAQELKEAVGGLEKDGYAKKIIFDLRGNGGGVSNEGVDLADLFLKANEVVMLVRTKDSKIERVLTKNDDELNGKYAVLVNKQTASASEVFVDALKSYNKAKVFGSNTYGKGIIDRNFDLANKFRLLFPTGVMYSPKGISWHLAGVAPDVTVAQDLKTYSDLVRVDPVKRLLADAPLKSAFEYLKPL